MTAYSVKYGIDRCPATKNYSQAAFCHHCDFKAGEKKDCCECIYHKFGSRDKENRNVLH